MKKYFIFFLYVFSVFLLGDAIWCAYRAITDPLHYPHHWFSAVLELANLASVTMCRIWLQRN